MSPMSRHFSIACSTIVALLVAVPAGAQTDTETIRARVKNGQKVSVTTDSGSELNGRISDVSSDGLSIQADGERTSVPFARIIRIDRPRDTLSNGALIGLGAGALFAVVSMAGEAASCDPQEIGGFFGCSNPGAGGYAAGALIGGGLGAALGVGIDALIRRDREIYRRGNTPRVTVAPVISPRLGGAVLSVSW